MVLSLATALTRELDIYTPCILEKGNMEQRKINRRLFFLIEKILSTAKNYFSKPQQHKIVEALQYAAKKHEGVYRKDKKTPYFMHPLEVAVILINLEIYDFKIIVSTILHDVPEDTGTPLKEISTLFGAGVKNIVSLVTVPPDSLEKKQYLSFVRISIDAFSWYNSDKLIQMIEKPFDKQKKREYWLAMKKEPDLNCRWRVLALKCADRIHNMVTIDVMSVEKKAYKIEETRQEFPELCTVLEKTVFNLYTRGTIKNKEKLKIPHKLQMRLHHEIEKHS